MRAWRSAQDAERRDAGSVWVDTNTDAFGISRHRLVFTWPDGSLVSPERWSRWFGQHAEAAGLPHIRLHDVRHSYATAGLAAARGWHEVKVISQRMGHAYVGITIDRYLHVLPAADGEVADTLARTILGDHEDDEGE